MLNFTCHTPMQSKLWSIEPVLFAGAHPTSIRGNYDRIVGFR